MDKTYTQIQEEIEKIDAEIEAFTAEVKSKREKITRESNAKLRALRSKKNKLAASVDGLFLPVADVYRNVKAAIAHYDQAERKRVLREVVENHLKAQKLGASFDDFAKWMAARQKVSHKENSEQATRREQASVAGDSVQFSAPLAA